MNKVSADIYFPAVIYSCCFFSPLICKISVRISTLGRTVQFLCYKCHCCSTTLRWCCGFSQQFWNTSKHPGGPKMLCQIKLNQWIPLQDPPHFQTDPGPVRSPLPAQSQKHARHDWDMGTNPHSLPPVGFSNINEWEPGVHSNKQQS